VVTKEWMLVVNRSKACYNNKIQVDALGFLGLLKVDQQDDIKEIKEKTPIELLNSLGVPVLGTFGA